jgi:hypothetical protein
VLGTSPFSAAVEKAFFQKIQAATEFSADLHMKERVSAKDYNDYLHKKKNDIFYNPPAVPAVVPAVPNPTATKRSYANTLRPTLTGKSVLEKIRILASMYESSKELSPSTSFTGLYRTFFYSKVKPVRLCLAKCFY